MPYGTPKGRRLRLRESRRQACSAVGAALEQARLRLANPRRILDCVVVAEARHERHWGLGTLCRESLAKKPCSVLSRLVGVETRIMPHGCSMLMRTA